MKELVLTSWLWASHLMLYWAQHVDESIFMMFKCGIINSGANPTNTMLLHVLIRSWKLVKTFYLLKWEQVRVEAETETSAKYKPTASHTDALLFSLLSPQTHVKRPWVYWKALYRIKLLLSNNELYLKWQKPSLINIYLTSTLIF